MADDVRYKLLMTPPPPQGGAIVPYGTETCTRCGVSVASCDEARDLHDAWHELIEWVVRRGEPNDDVVCLT